MESLEEQEKILGRINTGKLAHVVVGHMEPVITQLIAARATKLKNLHRHGKWDSSAAQAEVAAICALEDLEAALKRQVAQGNQATAQRMEDPK